MPVSVSFLVHDPRWKTLLAAQRPLFRKIIGASVKAAIASKRKLAVSVVFMSDDEIQLLNAGYRKKDKPTNVLSFPMLDDLSFIDKIPEPVELGDIVIAFDTVKREAKEQGKTMRTHTAHLLAHGTLHLLGHDHMTAKDAKIMEALEIGILRGFRIKDPYT